MSGRYLVRWTDWLIVGGIVVIVGPTLNFLLGRALHLGIAGSTVTGLLIGTTMGWSSSAALHAYRRCPGCGYTSFHGYRCPNDPEPSP